METKLETRSDPPPPSEPPPEDHGDVSSKGTLSDEASKDGHKQMKGNKEVRVDVSSEGTAPVAVEGGSSKGREIPMTFYADFPRLAATKKKAFEVKPTIVVNEGYRRLFIAAANGYWKNVERELRGSFDSISTTVMTVQKEHYNMLDIAVVFAHDELVEEMVKHLPREYDVNILRMALFNAARAGRIKMVKALHRAIAGKDAAESETIKEALHRATEYASKQKEVISYLANCMKSAPDYKTMRCLIMAGHLDIALSLAERFGTSISSQETKDLSLLADLAKMKPDYGGGTKVKFWEKCIYNCIPLCLDEASDDTVEDTNKAKAFKKFKKSLWNLATKSAPRIKSFGESHLRHRRSFDLAIEALCTIECDMKAPQIVECLLTSGIVLNAASRGILEIVRLCLELYPELMWEKEFTRKLIEEIVHRRHVDLFRLVNADETISYLTDDELTRHLMETLVASQPGSESTDVSGAAFLMQREIQWFQVLENRSNPSIKSLEFELKRRSDSPSKSLELVEAKERRGKTFWEIFVEERQVLLKEAGKWMKDTSSSCSLVATLIITMAFTAAFTIPGGNDNSTGIPILLKKGSFMIFAIADALALFSSVTATLMFLAILTSSYAVEDFRHSLPRKMILGLTFLFLSLAFMLVAFSSALTIVLSKQFEWIYIPIILLAAFPVALFAILQLPLYVEMVKSTYRPRLFRPPVDVK